MVNKKEKQIEYLILNAACIIGIIRMLIALFNDFTINADNELFFSDLIIDIVILSIFLLPIFLSKSTNKLSYITIPFSLALTVLLSINWFLTGGLYSTAEYHILAIIFLFGLIHRGHWQSFFMFLLLIVEMMLIYLWEFPFEWIIDIKTIPDDDAIHFISMAIAVTIGLIYLKHKFETKSNELRKNKKALAAIFTEIDNQNKELIKYESKLAEMNRKLTHKVDERVGELEIHKHAINEYMNLSIKETESPLKQIMDSISAIDENSKQSQIIDLLIQSGNELDGTIKIIARKLHLPEAEQSS